MQGLVVSLSSILKNLNKIIHPLESWLHLGQTDILIYWFVRYIYNSYSHVHFYFQFIWPLKNWHLSPFFTNFNFFLFHFILYYDSCERWRINLLDLNSQEYCFVSSNVCLSQIKRVTSFYHLASLSY